MSNHLKHDGEIRDTYLDLVKDFPLVSIRSSKQLRLAQKMIDSLLGREPLDEGAEQYLDALSDLVAVYEGDNFDVDAPTDAALLSHLLEAKGITQSALAEATGISHDLTERLTQTPEQVKFYQRERAKLTATELVCEAMARLNITRTELANRLGKTKGHVSQVLDGHRNMTIDTLSDFLWAIGRSLHFWDSPLCSRNPDVTFIEDHMSQPVAFAAPPGQQHTVKTLPRQRKT